MFTLEEADAIVSQNFFLSWDGWSIKAVNPTIDGFSQTNGVFFNGRWSVAKSIAPNKEGKYDIPRKYLRNVRKARG